MDGFGPDSEAPAVEALGPLFKLTEVFLWHDNPVENRARQSLCELIESPHDDEASSDTILPLSDCNLLSDDVELARQMNALGLPLSFQTNKERRSGTVKVKGKDINNKHLCSHGGTHDAELDSIKVSVGEIASPTAFYDKGSDSLSCTSMLGQSESSCRGLAVDSNKTECFSADEEDSAYLTAGSNSAAVKEQVRDEVSGNMSNYSLDCGPVHKNVLLKDNMKTAATPDNSDVGTSSGSSMVDDDIDNHEEQDVGLMEFSCMKSSLVIDGVLEGKVCSDSCIEQLQNPDVVAGSQSTDVLDHGETDNRYAGDFGDWTSYWDSFYMRNYFYNIKTHESTWDPPPGMECLVFGEVIQQPEEMINEIAETDNLTVSFQDSKPLVSCGLQCGTDSFGESKNDYKSIDLPPSESSGGFDFTSDKFHDLMIVSTLNCDSKQLNETQEINKNCYDENPLHLLSKHMLNETQEIKHSLHFLSDDMDSCGKEIKQLGCVEDSGNNLLPTATYKTELDCSGKVGNSEKIVSCERVQSKCHGDDAFQLSDASRVRVKALSEENWNDNMLLGPMHPAVDRLEREHNSVTRKMKKKARKRTRLNRKLPGDSRELQYKGILEELSPSISKYWCQRYLLFSRFDEGIQMDEEGWFSVTPEPIARHHAFRCGRGIILDCFTGVGGNAIQFAQRSKHVIAIDIDPKKIDYAQHNAAIYGVDDSIDFIRGDSFLLARRLKADTVFLSPPWGGPDYAKVTTYDIKTMLKPHDGFVLFHVAREIASKVVMFLPRNVDLNQLAELSLSANPPWSLEVEKNFLNGKFKAITAYFTDTSMQKTDTSFMKVSEAMVIN